VRTILKFTIATQLSVILRIQTKCSDTNSNNPTFQAQNNSKFFFLKKKCVTADQEIGKTASLPIQKSKATTGSAAKNALLLMKKSAAKNESSIIYIFLGVYR
jgi:hypothetical protein